MDRAKILVDILGTVATINEYYVRLQYAQDSHAIGI